MSQIPNSSLWENNSTVNGDVPDSNAWNQNNQVFQAAINDNFYRLLRSIETLNVGGVKKNQFNLSAVQGILNNLQVQDSSSVTVTASQDNNGDITLQFSVPNGGITEAMLANGILQDVFYTQAQSNATTTNLQNQITANANSISSTNTALASTNTTVSNNYTELQNHESNKNNPHNVTAGQVGAYTQAQLQTAGQASVNYANLTNIPSTTIKEQSFTASAGQTVFTLTNGIAYTPGTHSVWVFKNGSYIPDTQYTETNGTTITLNTGANNGDTVLIRVFENTSVITGVAATDANGLIQSSQDRDVLTNRITTNSGVTNFGAITAGLTSPLNAFKFATENAFVNGVLQNLGTSTTVQLDAPPTANVTPALAGSARDDLVFLEAYRDITGTWQYRIRVTDGVDFNTYPEGLSANNVYAQGGQSSVTAKTFTKSSTDSGMYTAGTGSTSDQNTLATLDGYVYAIPLFCVRRRNSGAYDPDSNLYGGATYVNASSKSDRPDGLYSNIIDATDIVDLRHQVSLTGYNYQALLEKNLDLLLRGQLNTKDTPRYTRDYIGIQPLTDDVNTLLLANFDGSINGTANGATVTGTMNSGSVTYVNGVQGTALAPSTSQYVSYPVSIASGTNTYSIEFAFKPTWDWNDGSAHGLFGLVGASTADVISLYKETNGTFIFTLNNGNTLISHVVFTLPNGFTPNANMWHKLLVAVNNGNLTAQLDGISLSVSLSPIQALPIAVTNAVVGYDYTSMAFANSAIDLVRVSNIARTEQLIPSGFSYANGDRILDGPDADFNYWSDDVGGTAGVNGRTNPYGLTHVPNQQAARVSYNGSEIRHYYGNGITPGWISANPGGSVPTGAFDNNAELETVSANETADSTKTTFTFSQPPNAQGMFTLYGNNFGYVVLVGGSLVTPSSLSVDGTGKLTAVLATAPANGASVQARYVTVQRHAHFVPSTKGFIIHDWTDDTETAGASQTAFVTTKKNVTSVNHVRVNGVIQNGGYSVSGTNSTSAGATITFTTAPASGATVDIVYESIITPALGDYIRIAYQHTPYQGLLGTAFAGSGKYQFVYVDEDGGFITTLGTGNVSTPNVPAWMKDYPAPSAQLPINGYDYQLKHDTITLSNNTVTGVSQQFVDNEQTYEINASNAANIYSPLSTATPTTATNRGYATSAVNDGSARQLVVALRDLASSVPHVAGMGLIAQDATSGELVLLVATMLRTDATNKLQIDGSTGSAIDAFKLTGRPLIKSYGGVSA